MKFTIAKEYRYWWPVTVGIPDPQNAGAIIEQSFDAQFLALPHDRAREIDSEYDALKTQEEREAHEHDLVKEFMVGWRDVQDEDGNVVPFSEDSLLQILQYAWFRTGIYNAYAGSMRGEEARVKN